MYRGIKLDVTVDSYETALKALEDRCKKSHGHKDSRYPGGPPVPLGHPRSGVTSIRMLRDESIAFRLYETDVVTWHPDNSVTVDSYPTVTTVAFGNALLPSGLRLGKTTMEFDAAVKHVESAWGNYHYTIMQRICRADATYRRIDEVWQPDEDTILNTMRVITLDRKKARVAAREFHLADFKRWLFTASHHIEIEHAGTDYIACLEALAKREFRVAAQHLPTIDVGRGFGMQDRIKPLPFRNTRYGEPVTMGSIERVRWYLYDDVGAYSVERVKTMSCAEYKRQYKLTKALEKAGVYP